jgi:hypothetical protein
MLSTKEILYTSDLKPDLEEDLKTDANMCVNTTISIQDPGKDHVLSPLINKSTRFAKIEKSMKTRTHVDSIHSCMGERLNKAIEKEDLISSEQFVKDLATSEDQGVSVMQDFYQKILNMESWNKNVLEPLIVKLQENYIDLNKTMDLLIDPKGLVMRIEDMSLNIKIHDKAIEEIYDFLKDAIDASKYYPIRLVCHHPSRIFNIHNMWCRRHHNMRPITDA